MLKRIMTILLIIMISLNVNMIVFADYSEFNKLYMDLTIDEIADNVISGALNKKAAINAIKNGEATPKFIDVNFINPLEKDKEYDTFKSVLAHFESDGKNGVKVYDSVTTTKQVKAFKKKVYNYLIKEGFKKKQAERLSKLVAAYVKLSEIHEAVKDLNPGDEKKAEELVKETEKEEKDASNTESASDLAEKEKEKEKESPIYVQPKATTTGNNSSESSLEDMINDADTFINTGTAQYNQTSMQNFSKIMYNILFTVGVFVAVIVGGIIGIKLMVLSAAEKADVKKLLVPYVVGCVVVFGGFGIWKLVVTILQGM